MKLPTPPTDACDYCRIAVVRSPFSLEGGSWLRDRFPLWDFQAHWLFRGTINAVVDATPRWYAPCGVEMTEVLP